MDNSIRSAIPVDITSSPIEQASQMLDAALADMRRYSTGTEFNIQKIVFGLGEAIDLLDKTDEDDIRGAAAIANIGRAMNHLRGVLGEMQAGPQNAPHVAPVTRNVAKTMAMLYPLSRVEVSRIPADPTRVTAPIPDDILERRVAPRIAIEAEVGFQSENNFFMGFSEDVSTGGLFVSTYDTRPIGAIINLNFTLPDGHLISVDGVVRWVREYNETTPDVSPGMGIQFERLNPGDKEAIELFIADRPTMFYDDG